MKVPHLDCIVAPEIARLHGCTAESIPDYEGECLVSVQFAATLPGHAITLDASSEAWTLHAIVCKKNNIERPDRLQSTSGDSQTSHCQSICLGILRTEYMIILTPFYVRTDGLF